MDGRDHHGGTGQHAPASGDGLAGAETPPLRDRLVAMALGRRDAGPLGRFHRDCDPVRALAAWFGLDSPVLRSGAERIRAALIRDIAAIDDLLTDQVNAILHAPAFQRLEASWRGVDFLVRQADGLRAVDIRILNAGWPELCRDFERALEFDQSQLFNKVYTEEFGTPGGRPFGVLLCDYAVTHRPSEGHPTDDVAALRSLARVAAAAFAPAILGADPAMFGLKTFHELGLPIDLHTVFQNADYGRWRALRKAEDSRFLGIVLPRVLMRPPWPDDATARHGFRYCEDRHGLELEQHCWGNAVYAFGGVLVRSFHQYGWFADIRGARRDEVGGGLVDGVPVPWFGTDSPGVAIKSAVEVAVSAPLEEALDELGFVALNRCKETPHLVFYGNQSVQQAERYDNAAADTNSRLSSMLRYMFCVSRFAHYLKVQVRDRVGNFQTAEQCQDILQEWLNGFRLGNDDAPIHQKARHPLRDASVQVRPHPDKPGSFLCTMHLQPHFQLDLLSTGIRLVTELAKSTPG